MVRGLGECHNAPFVKEKQTPTKYVFVNSLYNIKREKIVLCLQCILASFVFLLRVSILLIEGLHVCDVVMINIY